MTWHIVATHRRRKLAAYTHFIEVYRSRVYSRRPLKRIKKRLELQLAEHTPEPVATVLAGSTW